MFYKCTWEKVEKTFHQDTLSNYTITLNYILY